MPKKYVPFLPEPDEGQAVLGNLNRVLKYRGASDVSMALEHGMPLYEMELTETIGDSAGGNMVIRGECVSACAYLKDRGISIDLVYIDPPFASGADYAKKVYVRRDPKLAAEMAAAEAELGAEGLRAFEEKMYGDIWDKEKYLNWIYENLMAIKAVMAETASIYVHLDWHIGHYVKVLLDEVFGEERFRNEIIWYYPNKIPDKRKPLFTNCCDYILFYNKSDDQIFNIQYKDTKPHKRAKEVKIFGIKQSVKDENGNVIYQEYSKSMIDNVWNIPSLAGSSQEKHVIDYATQKPEVLLERIISASSNEGMVVADFFGGSGVTAAVAARLGRRFIHCDVGINSVQTARDRLKANGAAFDVMEIKDGVSLYRNPAQTMDNVRRLIPGLRDEPGLGPFWAGAVADSRLGPVPVYVPNLMDSGTRLLDEALINRIVRQAVPDLDPSVKKAIVYYVDIADEGGIRRIIDGCDGLPADFEIELRDLKAVLDDAVAADHAEFTVAEARDGMFGGFTVAIVRFASDRVGGRIAEFNAKGLLATNEKGGAQIAISEDGLEMIELVSVDCTAADGAWHSDGEVKIDRLGYVARDGARTREFWDGAVRCEKRPLRVKVRNICGDESVWDARDHFVPIRHEPPSPEARSGTGRAIPR
jgi:adenine-specific DNA-methyltransferase